MTPLFSFTNEKTHVGIADDDVVLGNAFFEIVRHRERNIQVLLSLRPRPCKSPVAASYVGIGGSPS
jgi:hypothetical protein